VLRTLRDGIQVAGDDGDDDDDDDDDDSLHLSSLLEERDPPLPSTQISYHLARTLAY
jgi:hypothetical protein